MAITSAWGPESFLRREDEIITICNPENGEPWPLEPPFGPLEGDPITADGVNYLQERAADGPPAIHIIEGYHGQTRHWDETIGQYSSLLGRSAMLWVETDWDPGDPLPIPRLPENQKHAEFVKAQMRWADQNQKQVIPFDVDGPEDPLRASLKPLYNLPVDADLGIGPELHQRPLQEYLGLTTYFAIREKLLVGMIGNTLQLIDQSADSPLDQLNIVIGRPHLKWITPIFRALDLEVIPHQVRHSEDFAPPNPVALERESIRTSMILTHQLPVNDAKRLGELLLR